MRRTRTFILVGLTTVVLVIIGGMTTVGQDEILMQRSTASRNNLRPIVERSDVVAGLALEVARLRERLDRSAVQQEVTRNPFLLVQTESVDVSDQTKNPAMAVPVGSEQSVATNSDSPLSFSLIGIALDNERRMAIFLLADGTVVVAGEGQRVGNSYSVNAIEESAAHISDSAGVSRRHELR
jgi:hypothetical protein